MGHPQGVSLNKKLSPFQVLEKKKNEMVEERELLRKKKAMMETTEVDLRIAEFEQNIQAAIKEMLSKYSDQFIVITA